MADASEERELSYSEFKAEQKRKRAGQSLAENDHESKTKDDKSPDKTSTKSTDVVVKDQGWRARVFGGIVDSSTMEAAMLIVVVLDLLISTLLFLHFDMSVKPIISWVEEAVYEQFILTGAEILLIVSVLESFTVLIAIGPRMFTHPGHAIDTTFNFLCVWATVNNLTFGLRFVGIVRLWRLYRLHLHSITALETQLEGVSAKLKASQLREQQMQLKIQHLEEDVNQAAETRSHHDQVMANYRTQIENLREALQIAAGHFVQSTGMIDQVRS